MKLILIILVSFSFSTRVIAQDTTVVLINNKKAAEVVIKTGQTKAVLQIKKSDCKNPLSFIIKVSGEHVVGELYKRSLEVSGCDSIIEEATNKPGYFDVSKTNTVKQLTANKTISLYLVMDPSNARMRIPSKRIYLGNLVMK